jgi:hypothetical protein
MTVTQELLQEIQFCHRVIGGLAVKLGGDVLLAADEVERGRDHDVDYEEELDAYTVKVV